MKMGSFHEVRIKSTSPNLPCFICHQVTGYMMFLVFFFTLQLVGMCGVISNSGVPTLAQQVKNSTKAAWITAEVQVCSLAWYSRLKDMTLPQLPCMLQLWLALSPWHRNFHVLMVQTLKKQKKNSVANNFVQLLMILPTSCL